MKFSKSTYFFVAIFFLLTKVGAAFNVHYCLGRVAEVTHIFGDTKGCGMELPDTPESNLMKKSCCDDKVVLVQNDDENPLAGSLKLTTAETLAILNVALALQLIAFPSEEESLIPDFENSSHSPPLYKLYCRLTLYA